MDSFPSAHFISCDAVWSRIDYIHPQSHNWTDVFNNTSNLGQCFPVQSLRTQFLLPSLLPARQSEIDPENRTGKPQYAV